MTYEIPDSSIGRYSLLDFLQSKYELLIIFSIWVLGGMYAGPLVYPIVIVSVLLLKYKRRYEELLLGFFFILILSDSRQGFLAFAQTIKPVYLLLLATFVVFDRKEFNPIQRLYYPFLFFFAFSALLIIKSPVPETSIQKMLSYFLILFVVPNFTYKIYKEKADQFLKSIIFFLAFILVLGLLILPFNPTMVFLTGRFNGFLGNPNGLGLFCFLFFVLFTLFQSKYEKLFNVKEIWFVYLLIAISVILSGSRNSIISISSLASNLKGASTFIG